LEEDISEVAYYDRTGFRFPEVPREQLVENPAPTQGGAHRTRNGYPAISSRESFPATCWPLLEEIRLGGKQGRDALDEFVRCYYRPAHAYILAIVRDQERARDVTQGFFHVAVLCRGLLSRADSRKGSFRAYFKRALRNYVKDMWRREERGDKFSDHPDAEPGGWERIGIAAGPLPDREFQVEWIRTMLEEALNRLRSICTAKDQKEHLELFLGRYLSATPDPPSWDELGRAFGLDPKTARHRAETVARHLQTVLRTMVADQVGSAAAIDEELATLKAFLS
jgi:RNA polymerase sigma factor (sigma-70 family)